MNQVSLCSTLGLQQDIAEEAANFPTYVDRTRDHAYRAGQTGEHSLPSRLNNIQI